VSCANETLTASLDFWKRGAEPLLKAISSTKDSRLKDDGKA